MNVDIYNPDKKYNIIYADPPWKYDNQKNNDPRMGGITYPVMELQDIKNMKSQIDKLADKDCSLFLWATMPKLREALEVIEAWGFKYITCAFTWVKQNPSGKGIYSGLGHWTNGNAELCLFAKRGQPKRVNKNVKQILISPRTRHSEKPHETRERIISLLGDLPRIELFARHRIEGWDCWGNEVPKEISENLFTNSSDLLW
jgi:site-specific DNA-methyltransferase (adenine-specific)